MSEEGILLALGYTSSEAVITQLRGILSKCDFTDTELEHIVTLNDKLKIYDAYIAMSNTNPYFKIKNEAATKERKEAVVDMIKTWSDKFNIALEKVPNKDTYYILGR